MPSHSLKKRSVESTVYDMALDRIRRAYDLFDRVAVAFSGGKDSTVILNLTVQVARELGRLPVDTVFWDEEVLDPDTVDYVTRTAARPDVALRWYCVPVTHRNGCSLASPYWYPFDPDCPEKWVRSPPPQAITSVPGFDRHKIPEANHLIFDTRRGTVGLILGVRADESLTRYRSVTKRLRDNYIIRDEHAPGVSYVKAIYDWTTADVWVASHQFGWDYNRAYDKMALAGVSPRDQRVAPPFGEQPMRRLWTWQRCWPEVWDKMTSRVPGARTAARYARSKVYGQGMADLRPPEGMTWRQAVDYYVSRHPKWVQAHLSVRLNGFVKTHTDRTTDPIPENEPHPSSGVCWAFMLKVAMRGDLKGRMDPAQNITKAEPEHATRF